jgi:hypothetical protein
MKLLCIKSRSPVFCKVTPYRLLFTDARTVFRVTLLGMLNHKNVSSTISETSVLLLSTRRNIQDLSLSAPPRDLQVLQDQMLGERKKIINKLHGVRHEITVIVYPNGKCFYYETAKNYWTMLDVTLLHQC